MTIKTKYDIGQKVKAKRAERTYKTCKCCGASNADGIRDTIETGIIETISIEKNKLHYGIRFKKGGSLFGIKEEEILDFDG